MEKGGRGKGKGERTGGKGSRRGGEGSKEVRLTDSAGTFRINSRVASACFAYLT